VALHVNVYLILLKRYTMSTTTLDTLESSFGPAWFHFGDKYGYHTAHKNAHY